MNEVVLDKSIKGFAKKCFDYFADRGEIKNVLPFLKMSLGRDANKQVYRFDYSSKSSNSFSIDSLFLDKISVVSLRPENKKRWFLEKSYTIGSHEVYLTNQWYGVNRKRNYSCSALNLSRLIQVCFGSEYFVRNKDGKWHLCYDKDGSFSNGKSLVWADGEPYFDENQGIKEKVNLPLRDNSTSGQNDVKTPLKANNLAEFSISEIIQHIEATNLIYDPLLIKRFAFSLMSKPFLVLSGLAGSGKTQLALAFAKAMVEDASKQMCVVSVGADWTNREPLLGFPNALQENRYVKPESGVLDLLLEANRSENAGKPYFLILDEMNMSYVERYFADFLSSMESHEPMALWKGSDAEIPQSISLPSNLFIVGTINVDETTYMFSPKVLDRANVIEFKVSESEMTQFLERMGSAEDSKYRDVEAIGGKAASMAGSFVEKAKERKWVADKSITDALEGFFTDLKQVNAEFGYRSAMEILRFAHHALHDDDSEEAFRLKVDQVIDCAVVQKLLPKLHGSRKKLEPVLKKLWDRCFDGRQSFVISRQYIEPERDGGANVDYKSPRFPLTADKICRMYESALANGFTSFAEA